MSKFFLIIIVLIAVGAAGYFIYQPKTPAENSESIFYCAKEQRDADVCVQIYDPVCAKVNIQCIKAPCDPINQIFSNSCEACKNSLVESYIRGECVNTK